MASLRSVVSLLNSAMRLSEGGRLSLFGSGRDEPLLVAERTPNGGSAA